MAIVEAKSGSGDSDMAPRQMQVPAHFHSLTLIPLPYCSRAPVPVLCTPQFRSKRPIGPYLRSQRPIALQFWFQCPDTLGLQFFQVGNQPLVSAMAAVFMAVELSSPAFSVFLLVPISSISLLVSSSFQVIGYPPQPLVSTMAAVFLAVKLSSPAYSVFLLVPSSTCWSPALFKGFEQICLSSKLPLPPMDAFVGFLTQTSKSSLSVPSASLWVSSPQT